MTSNELPIPKLNRIAKKMFPVALIRIKAGKCPLCNTMINGIDEFKDEASLREFELSGMCQKCQDETFEE